MTEAEWLAGNDPLALLQFLKSKLSQRKLRLFYFACCNRVEHLFVDVVSRRALGCARRYADGLANAAELSEAASGAKEAWLSAMHKAGLARHGAAYSQLIYTNPMLSSEAHESDPATHAAKAALCAVEARLDTYQDNSAGNAALAIEFEGGTEAGTRERAAQSDLFRDIFGNPFRPVSFSPTWRTDTALSLAKQMYGSLEFDAMPILADALQDAGCEDEELLNHCRDANATHVRGCWVVDLVLGKE